MQLMAALSVLKSLNTNLLLVKIIVNSSRVEMRSALCDIKLFLICAVVFCEGYPPEYGGISFECGINGLIWSSRPGIPLLII